MKKIDYHCHFSGSLSPKFLSTITKGRSVTIPKFGHNWKNNFDLFFETYNQIQFSTKSKNPLQQDYLYTEGSKDICLAYIKEGVDEFHLRIGPRKNLEESIRRIVCTSVGFKKAEIDHKKGVVGKIMLTLIHDQDGQFFNMDEKCLRELLGYLNSHPEIADRIVGFDFSGPEKNFDKTTLFVLLQVLCYYNMEHGNRFEIAIHAGEYIDSLNSIDQLSYIDTLLDYKIHRISHGTVLWLDPSLMDKDRAREIKFCQNKILAKLAEKKIHLEICPTANKILSPLKSQVDVPLSLFEEMGIRYSINTDNKTIFNTTLEKEWGYFPSNIHNPFETAVKGSKITSLSPK